MPEEKTTGTVASDSEKSKSSAKMLEQRLIDVLDDCATLAPSRILPAVAKALEAHGVRGVFVAVGLGDVPQAEVTVTSDDVTENIITQLLTKVLVRVKAPVSMAPMIGAMISRMVMQAAQAPADKK